MVKRKPVMLLPPTLPNTPIIAPPINVPHGTLTYDPMAAPILTPAQPPAIPPTPLITSDVQLRFHDPLF